jgi:hypothetical protein
MASKVRRFKGNPNIHYYLCASASPAFKKGDLVQYNSSGVLAIAAAGLITGIAMRDAPSDVTTYVPVDVLTTNDECVVKSHVTTADTYIGDIFDMDCTTTAPVTTTDSSHDVEVVGIWRGEAIGTSGGHFIVHFTDSSLTAHTG